MKKILVILTGGTIGSKVESQVISTNKTSSYQIIHLYQEKYNNDVDFDVIQPLNILSENLSPTHWSTLCQTLAQINYKNYQGIIITHGSDTLSYTSALIGMLFSKIGIPIVLVASNLALGLPFSNGMDNFRNAVCLIKQGFPQGVYTIFQNSNGENDVYLSTHIVESDPFRDQFHSFSGHVFGKMVDEQFELNPFYMDISNQISDNASLGFELCKPEFNFSRSILFLRPYPGLNYETIDLSAKPAAVLHYLYHSATACTDGAHSILSFAKRCNDAGIDFYCASFKSPDAAMYETSKNMLDSGIRPLYNISMESAYAKLLIAYNQTQYPVADLMNHNLYFESLDRTKFCTHSNFATVSQ